MTAHEHSITTEWTIGEGEQERDVILDIYFDFTAGYPETGPTYSSGGEPGEGPTVELNRVRCTEVDGSKRDLADAEIKAAFKSGRLYQKCIDAAIDDDAQSRAEARRHG